MDFPGGQAGEEGALGEEAARIRLEAFETARLSSWFILVSFTTDGIFDRGTFVSTGRRVVQGCSNDPNA